MSDAGPVRPNTGPVSPSANLPFVHCPTCGDRGFTHRVRDLQVVFICEGCGATWRYLVGYLVPTDNG